MTDKHIVSWEVILRADNYISNFICVLNYSDVKFCFRTFDALLCVDKDTLLFVSFVVCLTGMISHPFILYFSTLSHKRHDFRKNVIGCKMFILIFSTTFI